MLWCVGLRDFFREVAGDTAGRWGRGRCCGVWISGTSSGRWLEIPPVGGGGAGAVAGVGLRDLFREVAVDTAGRWGQGRCRCGSQWPLQGGGWRYRR